MRVLFVVCFSASLLMVGVGMVVALLPERVLSLSGSVWDVGFLAAAFAFSYLLMQIPLGYLADRLGAKPFLVSGYLLAAVSGFVFYFSSSSEAVLLGRLIQGMGEAPIWALGPAILSLAYPHAKGKTIGIYNAAIHIGLAVGPLLGIYLILNGDAGLPYLSFAALCLSGGVMVLFFLPHTIVPSVPVGTPTPAIGEVRGLVKTREPALTLLGILLFGSGYGVCISVLPAMLALEKGFDSVSNSVYFVLFYVSIGAAQVIVGPLSDRYGRPRFMAAGLVLGAAGLASFESFSGPWIYAPLTIASIGLGVFGVSSIAHLNDCVSASLKATVSASYYLAWGLGYFLGPLVVGGISGDYGYTLLAALMGVEAFLLHRYMSTMVDIS